MTKKTVFIRRAVQTGGGATVEAIGFADLNIGTVDLGSRETGRSCWSSSTIDYTAKSVLVTRILGTDYVLEPLRLSGLASEEYRDTADANGCRFEVTIPSTVNVEFIEPVKQGRYCINLLPLV